MQGTSMTDLYRIDESRLRARAAEEELGKADAQCRSVGAAGKEAAFVAYRAAFKVYAEAHEARQRDRLQRKR